MTPSPRRNEHGQPIGEPVPGWAGARAPQRLLLEGRSVRVEPVTGGHADALFEALCGPADDPLWTYRLTSRPGDRAALGEALERMAADPTLVTFAVVPADGRAAGLASLMRADPPNGTIEVGAILLGRALQRTTPATEAMWLLLRHLFDDLGYRRCEWKCDSLNQPSRVAARRLGFSYEGRFRQAVVYQGRNRDTDWFAMTDGDWARLAPAYDAWLDPVNFDADGRQRRSLSTLVEEALG